MESEAELLQIGTVLPKLRSFLIGQCFNFSQLFLGLDGTFVLFKHLCEALEVVELLLFLERFDVLQVEPFVKCMLVYCYKGALTFNKDKFAIDLSYYPSFL